MPITETTPKIHFETDGDPANPAMVLISGLSAQLVGWRDGFVDTLVRRGMFVIRPDNRDVGLSDKLGGPDNLGLTYGIDDMAEDICRVLDTLGIASAHIVGQSMGGAIAQTMAIDYPARVRSLGLIYTSPAFDSRFLTDELQQSFANPPSFAPLSREVAIEEYVEGQRVCGSVGYAFDESWMRELGGIIHDRCQRRDGIARQSMAVATSIDRSPFLSAIAVPTAILHGHTDRLVKVEASLELARLIAGAELHTYAGMGHEVVEELWDEFADILVRTARRATP